MKFLLIVFLLALFSCQSVPSSENTDSANTTEEKEKNEEYFNADDALPDYHSWYVDRDKYYEGVWEIHTDERDPYEESNRRLYVFLTDMDAVFLKSLTIGYRYITTADMRQGIQNFYFNLDEPRMAIYKMMTGDMLGFWKGLFRFVVNLVLGLGVVDTASNLFGVEQELITFAGVLNYYDLPEGNFISFGPLPMTELDAFGYATGLTLSFLVCGAICSSVSDNAKALFIAYSVLEPIVYRNYFLEIEEHANGLRLPSTDRYTFTRQLLFDYRAKQRGGDTYDPFLDGE